MPLPRKYEKKIKTLVLNMGPGAALKWCARNEKATALCGKKDVSERIVYWSGHPVWEERHRKSAQARAKVVRNKWQVMKWIWSLSREEGLEYHLSVRTAIRWIMEDIVVKYYFNNVQSFVIVGAAVLVISIGIRALGKLPNEVVYAALGLECSLLALWSFTMFYTPEDESAGKSEVRVEGFPELKDSIDRVSKTLDNFMKQYPFNGFDSLDKAVKEVVDEFTRITKKMKQHQFRGFELLDQAVEEVKKEFERIILKLKQQDLKGADSLDQAVEEVTNELKRIADKLKRF